MKRDLERWREWKRRSRESSADWADRHRGRGLSRGKRLRRRNPERLHRKRGGEPGSEERHTYGPEWKWVSRHMPCCVCGKIDEAPADHWVPVGRGGKDAYNCTPVCADHEDRHQLGPETWQERYGVDGEAAARWAGELYRDAEPGG